LRVKLCEMESERTEAQTEMCMLRCELHF
jgi:hypothetical protein